MLGRVEELGWQVQWGGVSPPCGPCFHSLSFFLAGILRELLRMGVLGRWAGKGLKHRGGVLEDLQALKCYVHIF